METTLWPVAWRRCAQPGNAAVVGVGVVPIARLVGVASGGEARAGGHADGAVRISVRKARSRRGEAVDVRRADEGVSAATQGARVVLVRHDENEVQGLHRDSRKMSPRAQATFPLTRGSLVVASIFRVYERTPRRVNNAAPVALGTAKSVSPEGVDVVRTGGDVSLVSASGAWVVRSRSGGGVSSTWWLAFGGGLRPRPMGFFAGCVLRGGGKNPGKPGKTR